jgi:hypothetical protein
MKTINKYSGRKLKKPNMKQEGNFTQIPNAFILNPNIRDPELRLLQYIMMQKENITITTKNCILYLDKTIPSISKSFKILVALGILKITNDIIEVIIPVEMKKYTLGYLQGKETITIDVKKTLSIESEIPLLEGKENITTDVKKTLQSGKENFTTNVKKTINKPLDSIDNVNVTNPIILNNNRVLPAPATSGSAGQTHSNDNTNGKTGIGLGLERVSLQSLASPSVLAPSQHTPSVKAKEIVINNTLPTVEKSQLPIEVMAKPKVEPDKRFAEQLGTYNTSKYFEQGKLHEVRDLYNYYAEQYPNEFMTIIDFETVLACYIKSQNAVAKYHDISVCLIYKNSNEEFIKQEIFQFISYKKDNQEYFIDLLKGLELNSSNEESSLK